MAEISIDWQRWSYCLFLYKIIDYTRLVTTISTKMIGVFDKMEG